MAKVVTSDYAQMLLNGVDNFTVTYFAEVIGTVSHDSIGRSIASIKLSPKVVREKALELIIPSVNGYLALDDSVMDKGSSEQIEVASAQYSGPRALVWSPWYTSTPNSTSTGYSTIGSTTKLPMVKRKLFMPWR